MIKCFIHRNLKLNHHIKFKNYDHNRAEDKTAPVYSHRPSMFITFFDVIFFWRDSALDETKKTAVLFKKLDN